MSFGISIKKLHDMNQNYHSYERYKRHILRAEVKKNRLRKAKKLLNKHLIDPVILR